MYKWKFQKSFLLKFSFQNDSAKIDFGKKNDAMAFLTVFGNVFSRNKKKFPEKTFQDFETNFAETKKCFELFCFENGVACLTSKS
ncbi:hypothetical protein ASF92_05775 [Pedobacter sp. Leaf176]|nr:hypothetical protein ASF92_05775 [Pedobacter sp. Leaf176]